MPRSRPAVIVALVLGLSSARVASAQSPSRSQSPSSDRQRIERGADSAYAANDFKAAASLYAQLTRIDSAAPRYWMQLGMSSAMLKDYATGLHSFERASALRGGPVAAYNVGAMLARLGRPDSAFVWLNRAIALGFSDTTTLATDDDLTTLRADARFAKLRHDAAVAPAPCRDDANYRRFDFWVGNWRVTTVGGQQVGTSHVDVVSGGCALLENWRDVRGAEGKSLNTFDPATSAWRQFWVGQAGGVIDFAASEWKGKSLVFTARSRGANGNADVVQRLTFTALDSGVVQQFGEVSTDGGKTWGQSYDFRYHPVK